ncbi:Uncharacterised protein [Vibrio cholerae]|nr:Uncharacterised protein [Vibrio cholerae]CSI53526.1 Uncharacterised protein [Vibrio cholerae]
MFICEVSSSNSCVASPSTPCTSTKPSACKNACNLASDSRN